MLGHIVSMATKRVSKAERRRRFLAAVRRGSSVVEACEHAGLGRSTVYLWADQEPAFEESWVQAERDALGALRARAYDLAMGGNVRLITFLLEQAERRDAGGAGERESSVGQIEIIGLEEGEHSDGEFIEFRDA
jgi:transposase-like protein